MDSLYLFEEVVELLQGYLEGGGAAVGSTAPSLNRYQLVGYLPGVTHVITCHYM